MILSVWLLSHAICITLAYLIGKNVGFKKGYYRCMTFIYWNKESVIDNLNWMWNEVAKLKQRLYFKNKAKQTN